MNSEIDGLLIQCGMCKKAYYCSMKCFNEHLPYHQKYCGTSEIPFDTSRPKKDRAHAKEKGHVPIPPVATEKPVEEEVIEEEIVEEIIEEEVVDEEEEEINSQCDAHSLSSQSYEEMEVIDDDGDGEEQRKLRIYPRAGHVPEREQFEPEHVDLKETPDHERPDCGWATPEWCVYYSTVLCWQLRGLSK